MRFKKLGALILGALLTIGVAAGIGATVEKDRVKATTSEIVFELGENGTASHVDGSSSSTYSETVNGYTLSLTNGSGFYTGARDAKGNSCIKLGTGKVTGSFKMTAPSDVRSVIFAVGKYKANTTKISVAGTAYTLEKSSNDGAYDEITVDTSSNKDITFTTVTGGLRAMLNTIKYVLGSSGGSTEPTLEQITVSGQQTEFTVGDDFVFGGTVTATYSNGNEEVVTDESEFSGYNMSQAATQTVTVSYEDKTTEYEITVNPKPADPTPDQPSDVELPSDNPRTYTFSDYAAGTQYANEVHTLDEYLTITTNECHFTKELRIYSSTDNNGYAIIETIEGLTICELSVNAGYKVDTLNIYGSDDGSVWTNTTVSTISVTSTSFNDYSTVINPNYRYLKIDVAGTNQVRLNSITIKFALASGGGEIPVEKTIKSIDGVATQPEAIYVGQEINSSAFTFNVTYSDDTKGIVSADSVTIDTLSEGKKTATAKFGELTHEFDVTVLADGVEGLSWTSRSIDGKKCFEGEMLKNVIDTDNWIFTISFLSGKSEQITGINDTVHVALYDTKSPTTENKEYLTADYTFKSEDNGKYLVACCDNYFSKDNQFITVVPKLNSIIQPEMPSDVLVATNNINIGDTVILANRDNLKQLSGISDIGTKYGIGESYEISPNSDTYPLLVMEGYTEGTYAFETTDGKYLSWSSGNSLNIANSIDQNSSWKVSFDNNCNATIKNASNEARIIRWNKSSPRFACYESGQNSVQLFKDDKGLHNKNLNAQDLVVQFATYFNEQLVPVCFSENKDFTDAWGNVTNKYNQLFGTTNDDVEYAKKMMKYATATWENPDCLQQAMKTYEFVVAHYDQTGFMEDIRPVSSTANSFNVSGLSDNATIIIALVAIVALSGFAFFYVTKRKNKELEF